MYLYMVSFEKSNSICSVIAGNQSDAIALLLQQEPTVVGMGKFALEPIVKVSQQQAPGVWVWQ